MSPPDKPKVGKGGVSPRAKLAGMLAIGTVVLVMFSMPFFHKQPMQQTASSDKSTKQGEWTPRSAAAENTEGADSVNRPQLPSFDGGAGANRQETPPTPLANADSSTGDNAAGRVRALLSEKGTGGLATAIGGPGPSPQPAASQSQPPGPPVPISSTAAWSSMPLGAEGPGPRPGNQQPSPQEQFALQVIRAREKAFMKAITSKIPVTVKGQDEASPPISQEQSAIQGLEQQRQAIAAEQARDGKQYQEQVDRMRQLAGTGGTAYHPGAAPGSASLSFSGLVLHEPVSVAEEEL